MKSISFETVSVSHMSFSVITIHNHSAEVGDLTLHTRIPFTVTLELIFYSLPGTTLLLVNMMIT